MKSIVSRVEKIYLGVSTVFHQFPEVTGVSERVLHALASLKTDCTPRQLALFVQSFRHIRDKVVLFDNIPRAELDSLLLDPGADFPESAEQDRMVKIFDRWDGVLPNAPRQQQLKTTKSSAG